MARVPATGSDGGELSYRQLEQLWLSAGGRRSLAPTMAAIAEAESGGAQDAANPAGTTGPDTAEGYWQIRGAVRPGDQGRLFSPGVNAREAVLKEQSQGLGAWTTYTSGAYKKFLQGGRVKPTAAGAQALLDEALKFEGTPYVWGGDKPGGFDCSGLVYYAAQQVGLKNVPRTSEEQWAASTKIPRSQLKPGDLVFYAGSDGTSASPGHVGIYAGGNQVLQAFDTGTDVQKMPMDAAGTPVGYGRLPGESGATYNGGVPGGGGGGSSWSAVWNAVSTGALYGLSADTGAAQTSIPDPLAGIAAGLAALATSVARIEHGVEWFFVPSNWVRIVCFVLGVPLVGMGIHTMATGSTVPPGTGQIVEGTPVPTQAGSLAPALGIAEVTVGAVLLFVAFHNLQAAGVNDFSTLMSYLQGQIQLQGAHPTSGGGGQ